MCVAPSWARPPGRRAAARAPASCRPAVRGGIEGFANFCKVQGQVNIAVDYVPESPSKRGLWGVLEVIVQRRVRSRRVAQL